MATYPELKLPNAWKPLFKEIDAAGWQLEEALPGEPWTDKPLLVFGDHAGRRRYLAFLNEPVWCGNIRQPSGLTIAALSKHLPTNRAEAEMHTLPLSGDWEDQLSPWLQESL